MQNGFFLVIEGIDGIGKSTQTKLVTKRFIECGYDVYCTKEPGHPGLVGETIRNLLLSIDVGMKSLHGASVTSLLFADHIEGQRRVLEELNAKKLVVQDRMVPYSNRAYWDNKNFLTVHELMHPECRRPDLVVLMTGDPAVACERARERGDVKFLSKPWSNPDALSVIQNRYLQIASENQDNFVILNSDLENDDEQMVNDYLFDIIKHRIKNHERRDQRVP